MAATAAPPRPAHNDLLGRTRHIAAVLTSHGLGWLVDQAELAGRLPHWRRRRAPDDGPRPTGVHLRRAFEDLGATFIKLGQVLSTRGDLLPTDVIDELSKLQDAVPAAPFAELRPVLERELGEAGLARFTWIDEQPLGSASVGQVHAARLDSGEEVVIKIQRPGVARLVEQDLQILRRLVRWLSANTAFGQDYDLTAVADEFAESLRAQLDFWREAQTADEFRRHFDDEPLLRVPRVHWTLTTPRVLTLERFDGIKISDLAALDRAGLSRRAIARNAVRFMVRQMFEHGVFHADPHPGNFFVQPNGAIALFDYGMVGRLGEGTRERLLHTGLMAIRRDAPGLAEDLFALGVVGRRTERGPFERDLEHVMDRYAGASLRDLAAAEVVREVISLAFRHKVQLPGNLALLMRVVAMGEGLGLRLDPEFRFFEYVGPMLARQWERQHTLERTVRRIGSALLEAADLGAALPRRMGRLFGRLERGEIEFNVRHEGLEEMTRRFERMTNRLALAVILGASIVALAMVFGIYHPAGWERFGGWLFGTAFVASLAFGAVVLFAIWRSGGRR